MDVDLEENGISVIPIYGVHFAVYARLFGRHAITKKCAIIADGDLKPSDAVDASDEDPEELPDLVRFNLRELENDFVKVFTCRTTFEREITGSRTIPMLAEAAREAGAKAVADRLTEMLERGLDGKSLREARDLVLVTAKRIGKARFAQVASKHVRLARALPQYIQNAVEWLLDDETE